MQYNIKENLVGQILGLTLLRKFAKIGKSPLHQIVMWQSAWRDHTHHDFDDFTTSLLQVCRKNTYTHFRGASLLI